MSRFIGGLRKDRICQGLEFDKRIERQHSGHSHCWVSNEEYQRRLREAQDSQLSALRKRNQELTSFREQQLCAPGFEVMHVSKSQMEQHKMQRDRPDTVTSDDDDLERGVPTQSSGCFDFCHVSQD